MRQFISGTFNGTGTAVYICCGFVPDFVMVRNCEATDAFASIWSVNDRSAEQIDGQMIGTAGGLTLTVQTAGQGIQPYEGGDAMTSDNQTSTGYGEGVYLQFDDRKDYKGTDIIAGSAAINSWTLDTSGNRTGSFNNDVVGGYIGEGSRICIDGKWYVIEAVSAAAGEGDDEVTLSRAAATGDITAISGMYDMEPIALGKTTPAGFKCNNTTLNVDDNMCYFEAGTYDNS